jgi:rhodanese-related sulfurtransferase
MKIIRDIVLIVLASVAIGLVYNFASSDPLPLLPRKNENQIPDSVIFEGGKFDTEKIMHKSVSYGQVARAIDNPAIEFIDARRPENYENGTIDDAVNIYPYSPEEVYFEQLFMLDPDKTYIVFCDGGTCDLSHMVVKDLLQSGFERAFLYRGGWEEWSQKRPA